MDELIGKQFLASEFNWPSLLSNHQFQLLPSQVGLKMHAQIASHLPHHTLLCAHIYPLLRPNYFWVEQIHFLVPWIAQLCDLTTMMTFSSFLESSYSITIKAHTHLLKKFLFKTWCQVSTGEEKIRATL